MEDDVFRGIQWRLRPELSVPLPRKENEATAARRPKIDRCPLLPAPRRSPENRSD